MNALNMASATSEQGLTQREASTRLGVSVGTINARVKSGDLRLLPNGRIDPASLSDQLPLTSGAAPPPRTSKGRTASQGRALREEITAEIAALDLAERTREVVSVAAVQAEQFEMARRLRDALLALPARLAPSLINLPEPRQIEIALDRALKDALTAQAATVHDELSPS